MLVSGYSGIGKSSVVNELHKVLVAPRDRVRLCLGQIGSTQLFKRCALIASFAVPFLEDEIGVDPLVRSPLRKATPSGR